MLVISEFSPLNFKKGENIRYLLEKLDNVHLLEYQRLIFEVKRCVGKQTDNHKIKYK